MLPNNGGNFVGGNKELTDLVRVLDQEKIAKSTTNQRVKWKFNPPHAPHFGGDYKITIKGAKRAVYTILGSADIVMKS